MSKDGYSGLDTVPFHWSSILNVMYGLYQKLFEGLSLHDKRFEGWWKRLGKNEIDQSADFFTVYWDNTYQHDLYIENEKKKIAITFAVDITN